MRDSDERTLADLVVHRLDRPPESGFDCGRADQNSFLYERAWDDQQELVSTTYLYDLGGMLAGYATVCTDGLLLSRRERGVRIRYESVGCLKLAQLGVDRRFQGRGLGGLIVADVVALAREISRRAGCRYLTVDAIPDVGGWYEGELGFKRNPADAAAPHPACPRKTTRTGAARDQHEVRHPRRIEPLI